MQRSFRRAAGVATVSLALAAFSGTALAGGGGGHGDDHGSSGSSSSQSSQKHDDHSQQSSSNDQSSQDSSSQAGVKPSNSTDKWTSCTTGSSDGSVTCTGNGSKPDSSKRYGNGKTAAQIAASNGAPAGTKITGPGNSQPHKVTSCKHSHAVDVHAVKSYSDDDCSKAKSEDHSVKVKVKVEEQKQVKVEEHKQTEQKTEEHAVKVKVFTKEDHKVTLCHLTGNGSFVLITVDKHSLKNGHTAAKGDIIPAPAGGCPAAAVQSATEQQVTFCDMESATFGKLETKSVSKVISHELNGTPEEARDIVPAFTVGSTTYSQNWDTNGQAIVANQCVAPAPAAVTPTQAAATVTTTTTAATTTTVAATTTAAATTTVAAAAAGVAGNSATLTPPAAPVQQSAAAPAQGGVLGATATLHAPKPQRGGVLGAVTNVAGSSLPFTGFPLWIAVLLAIVLIGAGLVLRGRGTTSRI
jgi:hypothetical protein